MVMKCDEAFKMYLKERGLRYTPERVAVLEELMLANGHLDVEELYDRLKAKGRRVSRATIYRTLKLLIEMGYVKKLNFGERGFRYEPNLDQICHDHMICSSCGKVIEFTDPRIKELCQEIAQKHGFAMTNYCLNLLGMCQECVKKGAKKG